jgi:hypothetical protein
MKSCTRAEHMSSAGIGLVSAIRLETANDLNNWSAFERSIARGWAGCESDEILDGESKRRSAVNPTGCSTRLDED